MGSLGTEYFWKKNAPLKENKPKCEKMAKNNSRGRKTKKNGKKKKKSGPEPPSITDLTPLDGPAETEDPALPLKLISTGQGQLGFSDRVYLLASILFQNNYLEKPAAHQVVSYGKERGVPLPEVKDEDTHRTAYELAFNTLKYQQLLEDMMIDSVFYRTQLIPDDQMSLVAVMLYDFQDRKFLPREHHDGEEFIKEVRDVESYLLRFKTKLAASLARCRIKYDLLSIECILPESVKARQMRSSNLPLYAWVNPLKGSFDEVCSVLKRAGFVQVKSIGQLKGKTFCQDLHCADMLVFPAQMKALLYSTKLLSNHKLIIQDKFCSLGPAAVCSLLPEEGDVLMAGCFSGVTVSRIASLIALKQKANCDQSTVFVCVGDRTDTQMEELQLTIAKMGCKNVKLILQNFQSLDYGDKRLRKVCVVLLTPKCSLSAISNPVEFILQENGCTDLLQDLSQGSIAHSKLEALVVQQRKDIDHALMFPKIMSVVYATCSTYPEENEEVVSRALEQAKARPEQEGEPKHANFRPSPSSFSSPDQAEGQENNFFTLEPTDQSNGCFLAVLTRLPEPEVEETPQDVLSRAKAKGILDKIGTTKPPKKELGKTNKLKKTTEAQPSKSINRTHKDNGDFCTNQKIVHRPSPQEKPRVLRLQPSKNSVNSSFCYSKRESIRISSPFSKSENSTSTTNITTVVYPAPPPSTPLVPVVRPHRAPKEVLKPAALTLPCAHFPCLFPSQQPRTGFSPSFNHSRWRTPAPTVPFSRYSASRSKETMVGSWPLF